jgi:EAL and modified HD-GYP domain-containing signal transduction protein
MQQPSLLDQLLHYEPVIDRRRGVIAMRLQAAAAADAPAPVMADLYNELSGDWPTHGPTLLLSAPQAVVDERLLQVPPKQNVWLEVPASLTGIPQAQTVLTALHRRGFALVLRGRTPVPLPPMLLPAFRMSIIHVDDDRRLHGQDKPAPAGTRRSIGYAQDGVTSIALMERCFETGAFAVLGWPMADAIGYHERPSAAPDYLTIMQLITMVDRREGVPTMEALLRRDPAIAYRLLRYINSPGAGLEPKVQSFRHAVMTLGYPKLKRCLAQLLASSSRDANMRPVMLASFRRGLLLEQLLRQTATTDAVDQGGRDEGRDDEGRGDEIFILGVLSLLDKLMKKPFGELFGELVVPQSVRQALVDRSGPLVTYLGLAEAIEAGSDGSLLAAVEKCGMTLADCNRAILRTLGTPELHPG